MRKSLGRRSIHLRIFDCFAVGLVLALAINMGIVFFLAFFNGGEYLVTVNTFGEQWVEAVLFPVGIIMGIITLTRLTRQVRGTGRVND